MKEQLQQRVQSLKIEYEAGQRMLADLEAKQISLRETLLRISGAIQVLEEALTMADQRDEEEGEHGIQNDDGVNHDNGGVNHEEMALK
jgi:hypothetical protein